MLFYVPMSNLLKDTNAPAINVVLAANTNIDGEMKFIDFRSMLGTDQTILNLQAYGERVQVVGYPSGESASDEPLVLAVVPAEGSPNAQLNVTPVYQFCENFNEEKADLFANALHQKVPSAGFTRALLESFRETCNAFNAYIKGEETFKIKAPEITYINQAVTMAVVRDWNAKQGPQFKYIRSDINKTNFMNRCDDPFFIEIPEYDKLRSEDIALSSLIPTTKDIAKPYPHPVYSTPYYESIFKYGSKQLTSRLVEISEMIRQEFTREELTHVPKLDKKYVVGSIDNNDLEIQPHEEEFYHALKEYILYDISQTYPDMNTEDLYKSVTASTRMIEFLDELVNRMITMNWMHTGYFPLTYFEDDDDEDDSRGSEPEDSGEYESANYFQSETGERRVMNGALLLSRFINLAATKGGLGFDAYIEAIIKLSRWGDLKPTSLKLGNFNNILELNTMTVRSSTGNISSLKPVLIDGKYEYLIRGIINLEDKFRDKAYRDEIGVESPRVDIPIGIACQRFFEGNSKQLVFISIPEIINRYKEGADNFIKGISYSGGQFTVDIPVDVVDEVISLRFATNNVERSLSSGDRSSIFYESDAIRSVILDFGLQKMSTLHILNEFLYSDTKLSDGAKLMFRDKNELIHKMQNVAPYSKDVYVKTNIARVVAPVILKSSQEYDAMDVAIKPKDQQLSLTFNIYAGVMNSIGYVAENQQWLGVNMETTTQPEAPAVSNAVSSTLHQLAGMNMFGKEETTAPAQQTAQPVQQPMQSAQSTQTATAQPPLPTSDVHPSIVPFMEGEKKVSFVDDSKAIIGCFAVREIDGKKRYILGGLSDVPEGAKPSPNSVASLEPLIMNWVVAALQGNPNAAQVRFNSVKSAKEIADYFAKRWEKIRSSRG